MASASHSVVSTRASFPATHVHINKSLKAKGSGIGFFSVKASSEQELDCNAEDCAPDKEVGKVSVEWLANEKTRVVGTYPPRKRGWTGYVEKDTAGQTNIYSVEPTVYVADSAISSGNAGTSSDGTGSTVTIVAGLALLSVAVGSAILLQLGKSPDVQSSYSYSGPPLSYYINKFKTQVVETSSIPAELPESPAPISNEFQQETLPEEPNSQVTDNS